MSERVPHRNDPGVASTLENEMLHAAQAAGKTASNRFGTSLEQVSAQGGTTKIIDKLHGLLLQAGGEVERGQIAVLVGGRRASVA